MVFKRSRLTKGLVTHVALIRFLSGVGSFVVRQPDTLAEVFPADVADKRSFVGMCSLVTLEGRRLSERLAAYCAAVRTITGVNPRVHVELPLTLKPFAAHFARVRQSRFVASHVLGERRRSAERLAADVALERLVLGVNAATVGAESDQGGERFVADVAGVRSIGRVTPALVTRTILTPSEGSVTMTTRVGLVRGLFGVVRFERIITVTRKPFVIFLTGV